jgi:predicted DNA-binding mobile mystery protein A
MRYKNLTRLTIEDFARDAKTDFAPREGWIKHTRRTLGVSATWLGARLGIAQSSVAALENNERSGVISLSSLRRAADALGYDVEYRFVPRVDPMTVRAEQARRAARAIVERVAHSMALEDQAVSPERTEALVEKLAAEMLESGTRRIWDVDPEQP